MNWVKVIIKILKEISTKKKYFSGKILIQLNKKLLRGENILLSLISSININPAIRNSNLLNTDSDRLILFIFIQIN